MGYGQRSIIKRYQGEGNIMNETSATMTKLYNLRNSIRKLYTSVDTLQLSSSISAGLYRRFNNYIDSHSINFSNYNITIVCMPATSTKTKSDIISFVTKKLKSFILENTEIISCIEEDPNLTKSVINSSNAFVCDSYIVGDTISFLL